MENAENINGAHPLRLWKSIIVPLIASTALSGIGLVFITALMELTTSSLLWSAGSETIGVVIYNYASAGETSKACSLLVVVLLMIALLMLLFNGFTIARKRKQQPI